MQKKGSANRIKRNYYAVELLSSDPSEGNPKPGPNCSNPGCSGCNRCDYGGKCKK